MFPYRDIVILLTFLFSDMPLLKMYLAVWLLSVQCLMSSAQLTIANNGKNVLQVQNISPAISGIHFTPEVAQFSSQQPLLVQVTPVSVENILVNDQLTNFPEPKNGVNIEAPQYSSPATVEFEYHNYDKMTKLLRQITARYPSLTALYSIGKSVNGKYNTIRSI